MFLNRAGTLDIYQVDWRLPELQDHEMLQLLTEHFRSQYLGVPAAGRRISTIWFHIDEYHGMQTIGPE